VDQPAVAEPPATQQETPAAASASSSAGSRGNEWRLVKWVVNGAEKALVSDSTVTVAFDPSGKIAGNASVNRFSGTYRFDLDGRLEWPRAGFAVTRMAGPPPLMAQERTFLESLRRTTQYRVDGQQLVLESQSGATVLTFAR
jgi:heat shock protein HslJ